MPVATFDTLKFANTLKAAGVPAQQAEAQAVAFAEVIHLNFKDLATKDDLKALADTLRQEMAQLGRDFKQEMALLRQEAKDTEKTLRQEAKDSEKSLRQETKDVEHRLNARIDLLAADVKQFRTELKADLVLLKWMFGAGVTLGVTMLGIVLRLLLTRLPG